MVMLRNKDFDPTRVLPYLTSTWSDLPSIANAEQADSVLTASISGGGIGLAHIAMPIPSGDLTGPVALAWHWAEAARLVPSHESHVIVHATSAALDMLDLRLFHTKLTAAVTAVADSIGVYVGDAMLVRAAADYQTDAADSSRENLPILSWIGFNPARDGATLSGYTTGLRAFGLLELEARTTTKAPAELMGTLADIAGYQLMTGAILRDGDTFGATEFDRTRVLHGPSNFIPDTTVARIELQ